MRRPPTKKNLSTYRPRRADREANTPIHYIPYFRKSSEESTEKQMLSLDRQRRWAERVAPVQGHRLLSPLEEEKSAKQPYRRPVFDDLVNRLKRGDASGIYTWKLDRLARNPEEAGIIMGMLSRGEIRHIVTSQRDYRPGDNALISYVDFGIADQYSRDLSSNVIDGLYNKAAMGDYPSHACLGYLNTRHREKGKNKIIADPERFDKTRQALQRLLTGNYSVAEVISFAENTLQLTTPPFGSRPARPMTRSGWYRFFANPLPSGWFEYPRGSGDWTKGNHPQMITLEEFDRIQAIMGHAGKPRNVRREHIYRGLIHCGSCPAMVTAEAKVKRQKNGVTRFYTYYHCTKRMDRDCPERSIEVKELERQIVEVLERISISEQFHHWGLAISSVHDQTDANDVRRNHAESQKALNAIDRQLDVLTERYHSEANIVDRRGMLTP